MEDFPIPMSKAETGQGGMTEPLVRSFFAPSIFWENIRKCRSTENFGSAAISDSHSSRASDRSPPPGEVARNIASVVRHIALDVELR